MPWTRALHLERWGDDLDSRGQFPLFLRLLIQRTVPLLGSLDFPAAEEIQRPGFDGIVDCAEGTRFVPIGRSGWELGVGENPKRKADEDFEKRSREMAEEEQRQIVFVFVTPRAWRREERQKWVNEKSPDSKWRGIVLLDGNDLEHWLGTAPDIDIWFSRLTGRAPSGVLDVQSYWSALRLIAEPALVPTVFTTSREEETAIVDKLLSGPADSLFMRTTGLTDGIDFLAALSADDIRTKLRRGIIVYSPEIWRDLSASRDPLVLLAAPTLELQAADVSAAVNAGHHVFVSGPRGIVAAGTDHSLRRQDYYSVSEALVASGISESRAMALGKACGGSSSILKRLITRHPETTFPPWSRDDVRPALAPLALVGGWTHVEPDAPPRDPALPRIGSGPPIDVLLVMELVGCDRAELDRMVTRWQTGPEPLFLGFGHSVLLASREDAWYLLGGAITQDQLRRFREFACLVLEEDDPAFQLAPDDRWLANIYGKVHSLSKDLRNSLVETLVLMATYPTADPPVATVDFKETVRSVLERVLPANAAWQRWASFDYNLTTIAEADPDLFLGRVEADLRADVPALPGLFQDKSDSFFSRALHSHLLWALETLAWSPDYLKRVTVCLAKLAARDPGGSWANRPANSLRAIFLWWLWHTNAFLPTRMAALADVLKVEPVVGWKLLTDLLPGGMNTTTQTTHMPRWRPWADRWSREKLQSQIPEYAIAIANVTIDAAGDDPAKWSEILDGMFRFGPAITAKVLDILARLAEDTAESRMDARVALWNELRRLLSRHKRHADAQSAFEKSLRERLAAIRDRLEPGDPLLKHQWLLHYRAQLPDVDIVKDHVAHDRLLGERRLVALQEIVARHGTSSVFRLLERGGDANIVGWLAGLMDSFDWKSVGLPHILDSTDDKQRVFINSFIASCFNVGRWGFVHSLPTSDWTAQIARFAHCLQCAQDTWQWLDQFGPEVVQEYWRHGRVFLRGSGIDEVRTATTALIGVGRGFSAIEILVHARHCKVALPVDLIVEVLEAGFGVQNTEVPDRSGHVRYSVQQLVKILQEDASVNRLRIARIEWGFLPFLEKEHSEAGPDTLIAAIESEPPFFVELLTKAYPIPRERGEDAPVSDQDRAATSHARTLLENLPRLPGTSDDGSCDCGYLQEWVTQVRELATACDRVEICDDVLGAFFARATQDPDDNWPSQEIAALMEDLGSDAFFGSFRTGVANLRGVVSRDPTAGGGQERELAERYRGLAENIRPVSPKVAEAFLVLARHYDADAKREDDEAHRRRLGR